MVYIFLGGKDGSTVRAELARMINDGYLNDECQILIDE